MHRGCNNWEHKIKEQKSGWKKKKLIIGEIHIAIQISNQNKIAGTILKIHKCKVIWHHSLYTKKVSINFKEDKHPNKNLETKCYTDGKRRNQNSTTQNDPNQREINKKVNCTFYIFEIVGSEILWTTVVFSKLWDKQHHKLQATCQLISLL